MSDITKYRAFISYSHRDGQWGEWLHRSLEKYRVPASLVRQQNNDSPLPKTLFPVFRDREELPSSANLGNQIQSALQSSRYLVVICSPDSARSHWVNEEILEFKRAGRENDILAIIVAGEPNASEQPGGDATEECFPPALRRQLGADGQLSTQRAEPIAADARPEGDGKQDAFLKIVAGLLGVGFNDLKRRELVQARRRMQIAFAIACTMGVLAVLAAVAAWLAFEQRSEARLQRDAAVSATRTALAEKYTVQSWNRLPHDPFQSLLLAAVGHRLSPSQSTTDALLSMQLPNLIGIAQAHEQGASLAIEISNNGKRLVSGSTEHGKPAISAYELGIGSLQQRVTGSIPGISGADGGLNASEAISWFERGNVFLLKSHCLDPQPLLFDRYSDNGWPNNCDDASDTVGMAAPFADATKPQLDDGRKSPIVPRWVSSAATARSSATEQLWATGHDNGQIALWANNSGISSATNQQLQLSRDGRFLISVADNGQLSAYRRASPPKNIATLQPEQQLNAETGERRTLFKWAADGQQLLWIDSDANLKLLELPSGATSRLAVLDGANVTGLALSHDGTIVGVAQQANDSSGEDFDLQAFRLNKNPNSGQVLAAPLNGVVPAEINSKLAIETAWGETDGESLVLETPQLTGLMKDGGEYRIIDHGGAGPWVLSLCMHCFPEISDLGNQTLLRIRCEVGRRYAEPGSPACQSASLSVYPLQGSQMPDEPYIPLDEPETSIRFNSGEQPITAIFFGAENSIAVAFASAEIGLYSATLERIGTISARHKQITTLQYDTANGGLLVHTSEGGHEILATNPESIVQQLCQQIPSELMISMLSRAQSGKSQSLKYNDLCS